MNRLNRFEHHRYFGLRLNMKAYDCDNQVQFEQLNNKIGDSDYIGLNLIQAQTVIKCMLRMIVMVVVG